MSSAGCALTADGSRRRDHRRHRARAHRQGRRLPTRRDAATRTTPGSTTWSGSRRRTGTCCPMSRPARDSVNLDGRVRDGPGAGRLHHRPAAAGDLLRARASRRPTGASPGPITGVDGVARRWVYLHYFKEGQPSINWLDPSFAGMRLVIGDALHSLADLGSGALRLDANGFLGVEKSAEGLPAWSEGHPLSEARQPAHRQHGPQGRRLHLPGAQPHHRRHPRRSSESGADLSYDFVNRPAYHHALVTGDTEFLRLTLRLSRELGVDPVSLVHASAESRRAHLRARALRDRPRRRRVRVPRPAVHRPGPGHDDPG